MPKFRNRNETCKGTFIHDQTMYWLDLAAEDRHIGLEPEIFRLAGDDRSEIHEELCQRFLLSRGNPWKSIPRYHVLHSGLRLDKTPWHYLCVTVGAGTGKTVAAEQAEYLLAEADPQSLCIFLEFSDLKHGVNSILGTSTVSALADRDTPLLIRELQAAGNGDSRISSREAWELLLAKIRQGKLTLIVDAVDQFAGTIERARDAAAALRAFLQRHPSIRCVVTGRPYAIQRFSGELFEQFDWDIVQLGPFDEQQAERRVGSEAKWNWLRRHGNVRMGVPRWIDVLRSVDDAELGEHVRTLSDLYLRAIRSLMKAARREQLDALDEDSAWYLFALLAFEMVTDPDGPYRGQGAGISSDSIDEFKYRIWEERQDVPRNHKRPARLKAAFTDYEIFDRKLGQLGALNEMLDDPVIAGNDDDPSELKQIFWRDQTLQDMFAALWMTRWATASDVDKLRSRLFVRWRVETADYEDMWRLATEMPTLGRDRGRLDETYIRTMSVLYERPAPDQPAARSTEMIWRSWQVLEQMTGGQAAAAHVVIAGFPLEYQSLLRGSGGDTARMVCEDFESGFVEIDPDAADWKSGEVDDDGAALPVVAQPYQMAQYTVTNDVYLLFAADHAQRCDQYGMKVRETNYIGRLRAPVVVVDWYDAWCFARWVNGHLPSERQWEYACRAGQRTRFSVGDGETLTADDARFGLSWRAMATEVDAFSHGNAWGLYQMHGNVWEWCEEWYDAGQLSRCLRGGSFNRSPGNCRSAGRDGVRPAGADHYNGFRVSRGATQ